MKVTLLNPLGHALGHYSRELAQTLTDLGMEVRERNTIEPSGRSGRLRGRLRWASSVIGGTIASGRQGRCDLLLAVWPAFGYWDVVPLAMARANRRALILHDPDPLVKAIGYGKIARWVARRFSGRVEFLVHGEDALRVVVDRHRLPGASRVEHPMLKPEAPVEDDAPGTPNAPVVRVLGQYKPDRNLDALRQIASSGDPGWILEIVGRGWPDLRGWRVRDEFVPEAEFEGLIESADVIPVPYTRFFQSGIAIRCLERGTPFAAPRARSITDLIGEDSGWIADQGGWAEAVASALATSLGEVGRISAEAHREAVDSWQRWLRSPTG